MNILIIGDSCIDKYTYGTCKRLSPEAPVPVFIPLYCVIFDGMAQNVYANVKKINATCDIITNQIKTTKNRIVDERTNHMIVRIDDPEEHTEHIHLQSIDFDKYDAVIVSDYNKGFLNTKDLKYIGQNSKLSFIDSKRVLGNWIVSFSFIKVNYDEYLQSKNFIDKYIYHKTIITLGNRGCMFQNITYPPIKKLVTIDTSGAGDSFLSAFAVHFTKTKNIPQSINFAQKKCLKVISTRGTSTI